MSSKNSPEISGQTFLPYAASCEATSTKTWLMSTGRRKKRQMHSEDADTDERLAVAREWARINELVQGRSDPQINRLLTLKLSSGVQINEEELEQVSAIFDRYIKPKTNPHSHRRPINKKGFQLQNTSARLRSSALDFAKIARLRVNICNHSLQRSA